MNAQEAVELRNCLEAMGHKQPATPLTIYSFENPFGFLHKKRVIDYPRILRNRGFSILGFQTKVKILERDFSQKRNKKGGWKKCLHFPALLSPASWRSEGNSAFQ